MAKKKISSPQDLKALKEKTLADLDLRTGPKDIRITIHMGTCGIAAGAADVLAQLMDELSKAGVKSVSLQRSGCIGLCDQEPMMTLTDKSGASFCYGKLDRHKVRDIVSGHVVGGNPAMDYIVKT